MKSYITYKIISYFYDKVIGDEVFNFGQPYSVLLNIINKEFNTIFRISSNNILYFDFKIIPLKYY